MELKDLKDYLGVDAIDLDNFKKAFEDKFIVKSNALEDEEIKSKITGRVTGGITTLAKREFGLTGEEVKGKQYEDIILLGVQKLKTQIEELNSKSGLDTDEKVKNLSEELNKYKSTVNDYKTQLDNTKQQFDQVNNEWSTKYKGLQINHVLTDAKSKISSKLKTDMTEAERFYLDHKINESIKIDFDENNNPVVLDANGKRIANPNKVGEFMQLEDVLTTIAEKENLIKKNNTAVSNTVFNNTTASTTQNVNTTSQGRRIHPNALKR